ncbi:substrate-binding periplasmic protein [Duganella sp. CT11-25]|jgi:ABC-type amino acid transport substrate-binding protein|uniref:substrate-binding periplasmic protein n=1 Tax=unclassified Duganella TaxID=2636909 RepID=UPI0039AF03A9
MPKRLHVPLSTLLTALLPLAAAQGAPAELVLLAPLESTMPMVRFEHGVLAGGILKDMGDALAQRMGRRASYLNAGTDAVQPLLTSGRADAMCHVLPLWIDGDYLWTEPLFPDAEMVVGYGNAPHLHSLKDLRDKRVGTVAGYRYPRVEQVLGKRFARVDAPSMEHNLQSVVKGAVPYTIISEATLAYLKRSDASLPLRPELVFAAFKTQCAVSRNSKVPFADVTRALDAMLKDGSIDQILARYR